jgi:hypothetical protein
VGIDPKIEEDATRAEKKKRKKDGSDKSDRVQVHTLPLLLYNLDILIVWIDKVRAALVHYLFFRGRPTSQTLFIY